MTVKPEQIDAAAGLLDTFVRWGWTPWAFIALISTLGMVLAVNMTLYYLTREKSLDRILKIWESRFQVKELRKEMAELKNKIEELTGGRRGN